LAFIKQGVVSIPLLNWQTKLALKKFLDVNAQTVAVILVKMKYFRATLVIQNLKSNCIQRQSHRTFPATKSPGAFHLSSYILIQAFDDFTFLDLHTILNARFLSTIVASLIHLDSTRLCFSLTNITSITLPDSLML
jgi:hypothetical protein